MEIIETERIYTKSLPITNVNSCHLFGCSFHEQSFVVDTSLTVYSIAEDPWTLSMNGSISEIITTCHETLDSCFVFFRTTSNTVYRWHCHANHNHAIKRAKLSHEESMIKVAEDIVRMISFDKETLIFFSNTTVQLYNTNTGALTETSAFCLEDAGISVCRPVENIDDAMMAFFNIQPLSGIVYAKKGVALWRPLNDLKEIELFVLNDILDEKIMLLELFCVSEISNQLNTCLAIGNQGTIVIYTKNTKSEGLIMKQFDINGPLHSILKLKNLTYIVTNGSGMNLLDFKRMDHDFELHTLPLQHTSNMSSLHFINATVFDALSIHESHIDWIRIRFNPDPTSIKNDPQALQALIEQSLKELAQSEESLKTIEEKETAFGQKLACINQTIYALKNIQAKRELGMINTLETTGFEFTVRPVLKTHSSENCCLPTSTYLRVCIKTSRFLELEQWDLSLDVRSPYSHTGYSKLVSVIGFEPHYEGGIERWAVWERDIAIDVRSLPLEVRTALIMTLEEEESIRFPLADMVMDDLHFVKPCSRDMQLSIERRGLDEVSNKLMKAYHLQMVHDRTRTYPLETLLQRYKPEVPAIHTFLFQLKTIHLKYTIDSTLNDEKYRSILCTLLCEGLSNEHARDILRNGAEDALFLLAAYPHSPVMIHLSKESPTMIDLCIQCAYPPALLKVEATLMQRIQTFYMDSIEPNIDDVSAIQSLEKNIIELQERYQDQVNMNQMDIDKDVSFTSQLKNAIDLYYDIHTSRPIGKLVV